MVNRIDSANVIVLDPAYHQLIATDPTSGFKLLADRLIGVAVGHDLFHVDSHELTRILFQFTTSHLLGCERPVIARAAVDFLEYGG